MSLNNIPYKERKRVAELETMLARVMHDGRGMIGSGYRTHAQMMLYAEATQLLKNEK
jgi:hypothetical protein